MVHALYFVIYAVLITVSGVVMGASYYLRNKNEGAPINYKLLQIVALLGHTMWTGAALTTYVYEPNSMTIGFVMAAFSIWLAASLAWQIKAYMKNNERLRTV